MKNPDLDDWGKLLRVLSYLQCTLDLSFTLTCERFDKLTWYVDGSYASHKDMRGQSGVVLLTGECSVLFKSCKQKVNTRNSTEMELITVDDILPTVQWTKSFMQEQGYDLSTKIKEDNKSTMLLMKNGQTICHAMFLCALSQNQSLSRGKMNHVFTEGDNKYLHS